MKNLIIIAAIGKNGELGIKNDLIWRIREDMNFFRKTTLGHTIVMGRNTFESLPNLLPNRKHIVMTTSTIKLPDEVISCKNINDFLLYAKSINDDIFVIGGSTIYKQLINLSNKMILTEIDESKSDADVYFPKINYSEWTEELVEDFSYQQPKYKRKLYIRK